MYNLLETFIDLIISKIKLNDKQIDNVMQKLIKTYIEKVGATIR